MVLHPFIFPYSLYLITTVAFFVAWVVVFRQFLKTQYRSQLYMATCWYVLSLCYLFNIFAYMYTSPVLMIMSTLCWVVVTLALNFLIDSIYRDSSDPHKLLMTGVLSTLIVYTSFVNKNFEYFMLGNQTFGWDWTGTLKLVVFATIFYNGLIWVYYCLKIFLSAPKSVKKPVRILLFGALLMGFFPIFLTIIPSWYYLGIDSICLAFGAFVCAYVFAKYPKIIFILPFRAINLTVIKCDSGIPLFSYKWDKTAQLEEMLFGGMIQGIISILDEAVKKGSAEEIKLQQGVLLLSEDRDHEIIVILTANKSSSILKQGLKRFTARFIQQYREQMPLSFNSSVFKGAEDLVREVFSFIPEY